MKKFFTYLGILIWPIVIPALPFYFAWSLGFDPFQRGPGLFLLSVIYVVLFLTMIGATIDKIEKIK